MKKAKRRRSRDAASLASDEICGTLLYLIPIAGDFTVEEMATWGPTLDVEPFKGHRFCMLIVWDRSLFL
jgi:hypothetical protein